MEAKKEWTLGFTWFSVILFLKTCFKNIFVEFGWDFGFS